MREITDSDELFNGTAPGETPVMMTDEEAKVIARALAFVNSKQAGELDRIMQSGESPYLKEAAITKYQSDTEEMTKLHMAMAEVFPALRQAGISAG